MVETMADLTSNLKDKNLEHWLGSSQNVRPNRLILHKELLRLSTKMVDSFKSIPNDRQLEKCKLFSLWHNTGEK